MTPLLLVTWELWELQRLFHKDIIGRICTTMSHNMSTIARHASEQRNTITNFMVSYDPYQSPKDLGNGQNLIILSNCQSQRDSIQST